MNTVARLLGVLAAWSVGVATAVLPIPFGGSGIALALSIALWSAIGVASVRLLRPVGQRVAVAAGGATLVLAVALLNWVAVWPQLWFHTHRFAYDAAVEVVPHGAASYYGVELPLRWRWLTVDGRVVDKDGALYFPQWYGMPDDGGGFFWSPGDSPAGEDMAGMICQRPDNLGDGWWMCGMG
jgi:hypothetical protein